MLIFVLTLFVIRISTSVNVRLSSTDNLCLVSHLYFYAKTIIRICISKHGCTSIGTNLCIKTVVLVGEIIFI